MALMVSVQASLTASESSCEKDYNLLILVSISVFCFALVKKINLFKGDFVHQPFSTSTVNHCHSSLVIWLFTGGTLPSSCWENK